jgi:GrpB-like predicted nucleotidyltransferase (UPF0157 family)/2'-5' RNA ligase
LQHDPAAAAFIPAHVTLLYPFVPAESIGDQVIEELASMFAAGSSFHVSFEETASFSNEILYLAPNPAKRFSELTNELSEKFGLQPYGGVFDEVVPHLTIGHIRHRGVFDTAAKGVAPLLPISSIAKEVWLMEERSDRWYVRQRFALGSLLTRPKRRIRVIDYDPRWPETFESERDLLLSVAGDALTTVEHVGSTAVPGLGAKPIVDILGGLEDLYDAFRLIEPLSAIGYSYIPEYETDLPERRYFHKRPENAQWFNLHLAEVGSDFWNRHIGFRDYLRREPEAAAEYHRLKVSLARKFPESTADYTDAKTPFIRAAEERALSASANEDAPLVNDA